MAALLPLPIGAPLLATAVLLLVPHRRWLHRVLGIGVSVAVLAVGGVLLAATLSGERVLSEHIGGWLPGVAITVAVDPFSALMLCASALLVTLCLGYADATGLGRHRLFTPLALALSAGAYGAYLTADLFNLFVFVEVMLAPSYALLVLVGGRRPVAAGRVYLTANLMASTVFLAGIGLTYGVAGAVNLGDLAGAARRSTAVAMAVAVVLLALVAKAALVPLHTWLPRTYPHAVPAVTALFSGLLTKVGVYAIFRVYAVVFEADRRYGWALMAVAVVSLLVGALGALGEGTMRAVMAFSMVSHAGFILVGPALASQAGFAAGIYYLVQYVLVKAGLLVCAGTVETLYGTGRLDRLGGLVGRAPMLAVAFMLGALSLAGMPPMSGFVAKLLLIRAAVGEASYLVAGVVALVGLLTLLAMLRVWNAVFWGHEGEATWTEEEEFPGRRRTRVGLVAPALGLAVLSLLLGVAAQPLLTAVDTAAAVLLDPAAYAGAVGGRLR